MENKLGASLVLIIVLCGSRICAAQPSQMILDDEDAVARTHIKRGLANMQKGDNYYAKQEFEYVLRMNFAASYKPVAYLNLGVISFLEGNSIQAISFYQAAIDSRPDFAEAYFNLGVVHYKQGSLDKAEKAFLKAIELQPNYGRAHYSLASVYYDKKQYDLSRKHAELAERYGVPYKTLKEKLAK